MRACVPARVRACVREERALQAVFGMKASTDAEFRVTLDDLRNLLMGEGGVDLEAVSSSAMQIVGVRPGTTAARLGAANGDTIETINGYALSSVAEAYRVADIVRRQDRIVIKGRRGDTPYTTTLVVTR